MIIPDPELVSLLLRLAHRQGLAADNAEDARARIEAVANRLIDPTAFHAALAACLADGTIKDPIRLEPGALQCRWQLELTPKGLSIFPGA